MISSYIGICTYVYVHIPNMNMYICIYLYIYIYEHIRIHTVHMYNDKTVVLQISKVMQANHGLLPYSYYSY